MALIELYGSAGVIPVPAEAEFQRLREEANVAENIASGDMITMRYDQTTNRLDSLPLVKNGQMLSADTINKFITTINDLKERVAILEKLAGITDENVTKALKENNDKNAIDDLEI